MTRGLLAALVAISCVFPSQAQAACEGIVSWDKLDVQTLRIPRPVADEHDRGTIELVTYLYRPRQPGPLPLLVYNHGSTGPGVIPPTAPSYPSCELIRFFTDKGFAIAAPNRRGRGGSGGAYLEECLGCSGMQFYAAGVRGLDEALKDLGAALAFLRTQPSIDAGPVLLAGQSRGGFLSVIYAGRSPDQVRGVVNFSGGWFGVLPGASGAFEAFNHTHFRQAGMTAPMPMLWLYREGDRYYGPGAIRRLHESFHAGGGKAELRLYANDTGRDGHGFTGIPALWEADIDRYLSSLP